MSLTSLLDRELDCLGRLLEALAQERQALLQQDTRALEEAVARKRELLGEAGRLDGERLALLRQAGLPDSAAGMARLIAAQGDAPAAADRWQRLLARAAESRERNRLNGGILELGVQRLQRTLNVLRGQPAESPVYGPRGRASNGASSRSLARA